MDTLKIKTIRCKKFAKIPVEKRNTILHKAKISKQEGSKVDKTIAIKKGGSWKVYLPGKNDC